MKTVFFSCVVLMCFLSIGSSAQKVTVDSQRGNDFSKYKTYAWGVSPDPIRDPVWNQWIIRIVDDELMRKGLTKVSHEAAPSLIVVYNTSARQDVSLEGQRVSNENSAPKVWAGWCGPCRDLTAVVDTFGNLHHAFRKQMTLLVDLADPQQKIVIWHGMARELPFNESSNNIRKIQRMVAKIFKGYPATNELASLTGTK
jgi:thiol-disulfide isomerase/thioredoxin